MGGRDELLAAIRAVPPSLAPPAVVAAAPLAALPVDLQIKVNARVQAGLTPAGSDSPLQWVWHRFVVPAGVIAAASALVALALVVPGETGYALIATAVALLAAAVAGGYALVAARDPLRLSADERGAVIAASSWQSAHVWAGELSSSPERAAVVLAARRAGLLAAAGTGGDLRRELEEIDQLAFRAAAARLAGDDDDDEQSWDALVERVARLGGRPGLPGPGTSLQLD